MTADRPLAARIQLFTGKGGVGKTTLVAATALAAAEEGQRPLVVELGHRASLRTVFGVPVGHAPTAVGAGVHACNVDFDEALLDYVVDHVRFRPLARRLSEQSTLQRFFRAAPAVAEIVTLRRLERLAEETHRGTPRWDPLLVDLDATGHALMFLALPEVFEGLAREGPLRAALDRFGALLSDARTRLHLVTLPAPLPTQETLELHATLAARSGHATVPLGALLVNRMPPRPLGEVRRESLAALGPAFDADVALAKRAFARFDEARACVARLEEALPLPTVVLPDDRDLRRTPTLAAITALGRRIREALA
ncbi:MAG: ArsA-related P-loop ATPase [Myxococcota bacterium]